MSDTCAWCDAPRTMERICPRCGADYAKAEAIKKHGSAKSVTQDQDQYANTTTLVEPAESTAVIPVRDPDSEWLNCLYAVPGMLLGAWLCQVMDIFDSLQRIVFGMPVHEAGHALTAWLAGRNAMPGLWVTRVAPQQGKLSLMKSQVSSEMKTLPGFAIPPILLARFTADPTIV